MAFKSREECPDRSPEPRKYTPIAVVVGGPAPEFVITEKIKGFKHGFTDSNLHVGHAEERSIETG